MSFSKVTSRLELQLHWESTECHFLGNLRLGKD